MYDNQRDIDEIHFDEECLEEAINQSCTKEYEHVKRLESIMGSVGLSSYGPSSYPSKQPQVKKGVLSIFRRGNTLSHFVNLDTFPRPF